MLTPLGLTPARKSHTGLLDSRLSTSVVPSFPSPLLIRPQRDLCSFCSPVAHLMRWCKIGPVGRGAHRRPRARRVRAPESLRRWNHRPEPGVTRIDGFNVMDYRRLTD